MEEEELLYLKVGDEYLCHDQNSLSVYVFTLTDNKKNACIFGFKNNSLYRCEMYQGEIKRYPVYYMLHFDATT
jgi:hypothetical protein